MKEKFDGIFADGKELYTQDLATKKHRKWDPFHSKMAAALLHGMKNAYITNGSTVLYLGASTGTTVSHVSDIVGKDGLIYGVEFAERVMRSFIDLAETRRNIVPIMADARKPDIYWWVEKCDVLYVDIAQPDQTEIAIRNAMALLKKGGIMMLVVKSQSIDVTKDPKEIYDNESKKLKNNGFEVMETIDLGFYEKHHAMIVARF